MISLPLIQQFSSISGWPDVHPLPTDKVFFLSAPDATCQTMNGIRRPLPNTAHITKMVRWTFQTTSPFQPKIVTIHQSMNLPKINHFCYKSMFTPLFTLFHAIVIKNSEKPLRPLQTAKLLTDLHHYSRDVADSPTHPSAHTRTVRTSTTTINHLLQSILPNSRYLTVEFQLHFQIQSQFTLITLLIE